MSTREDWAIRGWHIHHGFLRRLFLFLLAIVIIVLFVIFVVWLVLRPKRPKFLLEDASIINLTLSSNTSVLSSAIQVTISSHNPNSRISIYYDRLDVYVAYKSQRITMPSAMHQTYQGHRDVSMWSPLLSGVSVPVESYLSTLLRQDESGHHLLLHVRMEGKVRWKVGRWISRTYHLFVNCPAHFVIPSGRAVGSKGTKFQQISTCVVQVCV